MMKISDLIKKLEELKNKHGDVPVRVQTLSHTWEPEPTVKTVAQTTFILLNP